MLLAWLFVVVFSIPSIARTVHIYHWERGGCSSHACEHEHHTGHDCNTCMFCKFTLSTFTEIRPNTFEAIEPVYVHPEFIIRQESGFRSVISSHQLRAPPVK